MQQIHCEIKGLAPFFFSKPTKDKAPKTIEQGQKVALNRVYSNGNGLFVPAKQIKGTMLSAITVLNMKIERSRKRAVDLITAGLWITPTEIAIEPKKTLKDIKLEEHFTQVGSGIKSTSLWLWYGCIDSGWNLKFDMQFPEFLEKDWVKEVLENAGTFCGIGGRRLHGNGRFEVIEFTLG